MTPNHAFLKMSSEAEETQKYLEAAELKQLQAMLDECATKWFSAMQYLTIERDGAAGIILKSDALGTRTRIIAQRLPPYDMSAQEGGLSIPPHLQVPAPKKKPKQDKKDPDPGPQDVVKEWM